MVPPYIGHTLSKVWVICVLVSQVCVFFGVFSTELLPLPGKITEVGRLSLFIEFFVGFHIVCDRYTLEYAHFTYFNTIWPLSLSSGFGSEVYPWPENLSYVIWYCWPCQYFCQQIIKEKTHCYHTLSQNSKDLPQFSKLSPKTSLICIASTMFQLSSNIVENIEVDVFFRTSPKNDIVKNWETSHR